MTSERPATPRLKSLVEKRSVKIHGHQTSASLEPAFWEALKEIAAHDQLSISALVEKIDGDRGEAGNLSSAIRLFVLDHYRQQAAFRSASAANEEQESNR
jgi:predicted DNA-binding ribbon-helix-helix protein